MFNRNRIDFVNLLDKLVERLEHQSALLLHKNMRKSSNERPTAIFFYYMKHIVGVAF